MNNSVTKRRTLSSLISAACLAAAVAVTLLALGASPATPATSAGDTQPLKERVAQAGRNLMIAKSADFSTSYDDLAALARDSDLVIVGTTLTNRCFLTADGKNVTTNYIVEAQDVLKGDLKKGARIKVSTPGGRVSFGDHYAQVSVVGGYRKMQNNMTFVLFLKKNDGNAEYQLPYGNDFFVTLGGAQGIFELPADGSGVKPANIRRNHTAVKAHKDKGVKNFLKEVRDAVKG
ncbi:MAG: hypothetical protein ABW250_02550 [Pyrinomonadaceae bacterium]